MGGEVHSQDAPVTVRASNNIEKCFETGTAYIVDAAMALVSKFFGEIMGFKADITSTTNIMYCAIHVSYNPSKESIRICRQCRRSKVWHDPSQWTFHQD